ncbi:MULTISPECIES: hypothetical protein [Pseudomonas]|jgi:hypothetical protein|uniref:hypothetical protein n=1 Tax=Pseudomonas TaxID=286 RepID=UPI000715A0FD|nr:MULTISPECIES: hypothetical protein [Pseudomonas]KRP87384.1 hypothetical protein TX25_25765 [Pseudomonas lactis]
MNVANADTNEQTLRELSVTLLGKIVQEIANSEIQDERHAKLQQAKGMARAYRELQVVPAKLTFSFEGHIERVYRRLDAPQHAPASELEW